MDFFFAIFCAALVIGYPIFNGVFLYRNVDKLNTKEFKATWGSCYDGYLIYSAANRRNVIILSSWFLFRRFLLAINLIFVVQVIWVQLTINMLLCLADLALKMYLRPYNKDRKGFFMFFNDHVVLFLSYFMYVFTDLTPTQEDKYFIGW